MRKTVLIIALAFGIIPVFGQEVKLEILPSQESSTLNDDVIGITKDNVIYTYGYEDRFGRNSSYVIYDGNTGSILNEVDYFKDLRGDNKEILNVYVEFEGNEPLVISETYEDKVTTFYGNKLDEKGKIISQFEILKGESCAKGSALTPKKYRTSDIYWIKDTITKQNHFFTTKTCERTDLKDHYDITLSIASFDEDMSNKTENTVQIPVKVKGIVDYLIFNNDIYIIVDNLKDEEVRGSKNIKAFTGYNLIKVTLDGSLEILDLPLEYKGEGLKSFQFAVENQKLVLNATIHQPGKEKKVRGKTIYSDDGIIGLWRCVISDEMSLDNVSAYYFKESLITQFFDKKQHNKASKKDERITFKDDKVNNLKLVNTFPTSDGGSYSLFQNIYHYVRTRTDSKTGAVTTTYYYCYEKYLVLKSDEEGNIEWVKGIPLNYVSVNYNPGRATSALIKEDVVYIFHTSNDQIREQIQTQTFAPGTKRSRGSGITEIAITSVDLDGTISYHKVMNTKTDTNVMKILRGDCLETNGDDAFFYMNRNRKAKSAKEAEVFRITIRD